MKCTILGCGGSDGVPQIGCSCIVCKSDNSKNLRSRASILIESQNTRILIDTSPDLRTQALVHNIDYVDAILYTHAHSDHVGGINDTKLLSKSKKAIPAYMDKSTYNALHKSFEYIFKQKNSLYRPLLKAHIIKEYEKLQIGDTEIIPYMQSHPPMDSLGFRVGNLAYSTDVGAISEKTFRVLEGVEYWIIDCLRYYFAPTHSYLEKTLDWITRVNPKLAILTHMNHYVDYDELKKILPGYIVPAYDGMVINTTAHFV